MAQKNYEKLLTELMKKIPQNRLAKHLFLNYTIGKGGNEFLVINKICKRIFGKPANREEECRRNPHTKSSLRARP